jgi:hypothetical protein
MDELRADLVHAPRIEVDASGVVRCGVTNAELRYAPSQFVPASLWLVRRDVVMQLKGWRAARSIHASNPSQDFLVRAWRKTKLVACVPRITAIILASGGRRGAYLRRDASQHADLFARMNVRGFREQFLTDAVLAAEREAAGLRAAARPWPARLNQLADRVLAIARLHPDAVRNRLRRRPKGHWIAQLRQYRGLPPAPDGGTE